jgi:uroporphyrin-3 C-methyltransferase
MTDEQTQAPAKAQLAEKNQTSTSRSSLGSMCVFFFTLAFIALICGFGYGYFQLSQVNTRLAHMVRDLQTRVVSNESNTHALQKSLTGVQESTQKSQELSKQQEQLMSDWHAAQQGDLNKWHVAEAQHLAKMANDQLQFAHNIPTAVLLLQQAGKELANSQDSAVLDIRKSLATDLSHLQALPQVDATAAFVKLNALNSLVDKLPLPINPLTEDKPESIKSSNLTLPDSNDSTANTSASPANTSNANTSTNTNASNANASTNVNAGNASTANQTPWWKTGLNSAWQGLSKFVVIRKNETGSMPLVMPEEKAFLYQNLHAQLEAAGWGLLHNNAEVYNASLARASAWVGEYFNQEAPETKTMLQGLADLQKLNIQAATSTASVTTNLAATLQLFDKYFAASSASSVTSTSLPSTISLPLESSPSGSSPSGSSVLSAPSASSASSSSAVKTE